MWLGQFLHAKRKVDLKVLQVLIWLNDIILANIITETVQTLKCQSLTGASWVDMQHSNNSRTRTPAWSTEALCWAGLSEFRIFSCHSNIEAWCVEVWPVEVNAWWMVMSGKIIREMVACWRSRFTMFLGHGHEMTGMGLVGTNGHTFRRRREIEVWRRLLVLRGVDQLVVSGWHCDEMAGSRSGSSPETCGRQDSHCLSVLMDLFSQSFVTISRNLVRTVFGREFICWTCWKVKMFKILWFQPNSVCIVNNWLTFNAFEDFDRTKSRSSWAEDPVHRQSVESTEWIEAPHCQPVQESDCLSLLCLSQVFVLGTDCSSQSLTENQELPGHEVFFRFVLLTWTENLWRWSLVHLRSSVCHGGFRSHRPCMTPQPVKNAHLLNCTTSLHLHIFWIRTMALVPHESGLNSNRTLAPSVCLGPQVGSSRVVPSGCSVGQVEVGVVTTVMVPSAEQTDTTDGCVRVVPDSGGNQSE